MENDTDYNERAYTTSEVATMLDIAIPTVRKYSQTLERAGYVFIKSKATGKHQARLFIEKDVTALRYFKQLREKSNIKVEEAASIIIEKFGKGAIQSVRGNDTKEIVQYEEQYNELKEMIHKQTETINRQNEMIEGLAEQLKQQGQYIDKRLNERDERLTQSMNEIMEQRKQIAVEQEQEQKKGFFNRLFKK